VESADVVYILYVLYCLVNRYNVAVWILRVLLL